MPDDPMPPSAWRHVLEHGHRGEDVEAWQRVLLGDERDLGPWGADGAFGGQTHNATMGWQRARSLEPDGRVGPATRAMIGRGALPQLIRALSFDALPFVEAANWSRRYGPQRKRLIVLHCMEAPEASTRAERCAAWFAGERGPPPRASAHACIDSDSVVQCVPWDRVAWHAPGANRVGIGLELAGYARQTRRQWRDDFSARTLDLAAWVSWHLVKRFGIPIEYVPAQDLHEDRPGFTTHAQVSRAFGRSSHWDPGPHFPMEGFLDQVRATR